MVNPNAAYDKFKDKHVSTKGLGQFALDTQVFTLLSAYLKWISCRGILNIC